MISNKIKIELNRLKYSLLWCRYNLYKSDYNLDVLLIYLNNIKINSIDSSTYHCEIIFDGGTKVIFWNENRWYAWMNNGEIEFENGKKLDWNNRMPSDEVLYKLKKIVRKYEKSIKKSDINIDFSEYLPTKLSRKCKLNKLDKI